MLSGHVMSMMFATTLISKKSDNILKARHKILYDSVHKQGESITL